MKNISYKIPAIVLGISLLISVVIFSAFYLGLIGQKDMNRAAVLDVLLNWMYILLGINILAAFAGIVWGYFKNR